MGIENYTLAVHRKIVSDLTRLIFRSPFERFASDFLLSAYRGRVVTLVPTRQRARSVDFTETHDALTASYRESTVKKHLGRGNSAIRFGKNGGVRVLPFSMEDYDSLSFARGLGGGKLASAEQVREWLPILREAIGIERARRERRR